MLRLARIVIPGLPHHVTQRGNHRQEVFLREEDRAIYLELLQAQAALYSLSLLGYCLMTNHVHHLTVPALESSLARAVGGTHLRYTLQLNARERWQGHLWQNRFYSCPMEEDYCWRVLRYIELNPLRAGMVEAPEDYPWSSAAVHLGLRPTPPWLEMTTWSATWTPATWREYLLGADADEDLLLLRAATALGRPLGSAAFLDRLEALTGLSFRVNKRRRPKKTEGEKVGHR
ncbi:MAG: transposase [Armatimonadota bacterium]